MSMDSVNQLQTLDFIMKEQFEAFSVDTAMVLGIAGGNGLRHVHSGKYKKIYGIDINETYLSAVSERYKALSGILECKKIDLTGNIDELPKTDFVIANLLVEYIGYDAFKKVVEKVQPRYVSCVIQINTDDKNWVSDSPYIHVFDRLDEVHTQMEEDVLTDAMKSVGYAKIDKKTFDIPGGKALVKIDYTKL
ncbi:MAG: class I SAM-dependent methyltransferase [Lachnospiraceae bacterium]|nr:class I SAM-dependent methyltransferase [Lachnospiraceae bacterium]